MRIERIHVTGFGRTRGLDLALDPGANLVIGPNGAGKSTLAELIRSIIFGFDPTRPYTPAAGTPRGGWMEVRLADGRLVRIDRHADRGEHRELLLTIDGSPVADARGELARIVGPLDRTTFEALYAFGLDDLTGLGRMSTDDLIAGILGPAIGPFAALEATRAALEAGSDDGAHRVEIATLLRRLTDLDRRLAEADPPRRYREAAERANEAGDALAALDRRLDTLHAEQRAADRLARAIPHVRSLMDAEAAITALGAPPDLERIEPLVAEARGRIAGAERGVAAAHVLLDGARASRDATPPADLALLAAAPRIDALVASLDLRTAQASRADALGRELADTDADAARVAASAGTWCTAEWIVTHAPLGELRATLAGRAEALLAAPARRLDAARARADEATAALADAERAADAAPAPAAPTGETVTSLRASIEAAERSQRDLDAAIAIRDAIGNLPELPARAPSRASDPRIGFLLAIVVAFAGALVAMATGMRLLPPDVPPSWAAGAWIAAVTVLGLLIIRVQALHRRRNARETDALADGRRNAAERLREAEEAVSAAEAARRLAYATLGVAVVGQLDGPRARVATLALEDAERAAAQARHDAAVATVAARQADRDAADAAVETARAAVEAARQEWHDELAGRGIPGELDAVAVDRALDAARDARLRMDRAAGIRAELERLEAERSAWEDEAWAVLEPLDLVSVGAVVEEAVRGAAEHAREARDADRVRRDAEAVADRAADGLDAAIEEEAATRTALAELLAREGFADEAALVAARTRAQERAVHERTRDAARAALAAIAAAGEPVDALIARADGADPDRAREAADALGATLAGIERDRASALGRLGAERATIERLERETETGAIRLEQETIRARLRTVVADRLAAVAATGLLAEARRRYETAHRPALLEAAERWFLDWTGDEYEAISAPTGRAAEGVRRADGDLHGVAALSRGTREQLYLALRFGLIDHLATEREPMPLVMDEILVDFDATRLPRVRDAIAAMAQRHQVIFLTFHEDAYGLPGRRIELPSS